MGPYPCGSLGPCLAISQDWHEAHPDYWKNYRAGHPEYTQKNRDQTRLRKQQKGTVQVGSGASGPKSGLHWILSFGLISQLMNLQILKGQVTHEPPFLLACGKKKKENVSLFLKLLHLRGVSDKTVRAYAYDLLAFWKFLGEKDLSLDILEVSHFADFILSQKKEGSSPRTINRRLVVVRAFLNFESEGRGDELFGKTISSFYKGRRNKALLGKSRIKGAARKPFKLKVPAVLITPLSEGEIKKFLTGIRKYRDIAILYLMLFCGLRSCEVLALETGDFDDDDQIRVRGKGNKERILPIPASVRQALRRYLDYERPETDHKCCFVVLKGPHLGRPLTAEGLRTLFRHHRKTSSLKKANPHKFRHTFCTNMIRQGVSLPVVQKLMGHSDIEVTLGYVHLSMEDVSKEYQ
ncbi:MAG: tyrosine-type recombinase/integrase [Deltaproteobacteria bacterium]|nr:tyrosine-type recombinase/integrase [Deltaproteobacteria bacterium]